jgi:Type II secretion system (T2SS), protein F
VEAPRALERLARARAASTLAGMLDAGLPVQEALERAADASGRVLLGEALTAVASAVRSGATLAEAFERAGIDAGLRTVVATGERSGTLPQSLSAYAQLERDAGLHNLRMTARLSTTVFALGAFAYLGWRAFAQVNEVRETFDRLLDVDPRQLVPGLEEGLRELRQAVE